VRRKAEEKGGRDHKLDGEPGGYRQHLAGANHSEKEGKRGSQKERKL